MKPAFLAFFVKMDVSISENDQKISESEEVEENIVQSELLHPLSPDSEKPPSIISQNGEIPNGVKNKLNGEYGKALNQHDVRRIQLSLNEFICKALLPYMERQCRNLNESVSTFYQGQFTIQFNFCDIYEISWLIQFLDYESKGDEQIIFQCHKTFVWYNK